MKSLSLLAVLALAVPAVAQPNDTFVGRTPLTGAEVSVTGSNANATKDAGEPNHGENVGGMSVWWSWTAPDTGNVTVSTAGSSFDTTLAVYTGQAVDALTLVAQNDDAGGPQSAVTFAAEEGTTYVIAVDGYNHEGTVASGDIQLSIAPAGGGGGGGDPEPGTYTPQNATYNGLITGSDGLAHETSGYITIKTTSRGRFTSKMVVGGQRYSASGQLDNSGAATATVNARGAAPVELQLQVDETGDVITGTISDGTWAGDIIADRAVYNQRTNPSPLAGTYTLAMPGSPEDPSAVPAGTSVGTVTIRPNGQLRFAGSMADGTKVSQSTLVSANGQWPLYAPLYRGQGSVVGWLTLDGEAEDDISGPVVWTKNAGAKSKNYPEGFILETTAMGSAYTAVKGEPVLPLTDAQLWLEGANLSEGIYQDVTLNSKNQITTADNNARLKVSTKNGLIKGNVTTTAGRIPVNAVVLQNQGYVTGYFLSGNQSGRVYIGPPAEEPDPENPAQ